MDLIFAHFVNGVIEDDSVLMDYSFDETYGIGDSVNDFQIKVQEYNHLCKADDVVYIEFTEYGGIIDKVKHDKKTGEITYTGRTWHGILNSKVIVPPTGAYMRVYSGEINDILADMIADVGLGNIFTADAVLAEDKGIYVDYFPVRYEKVYDAMIRLMQLKNDDGVDLVNGKLIMYFLNGKVHIGAVQCVDYSIDEEFDSKQVPYTVAKSFNDVNHLICMGQGEGLDRAIIHLYTDDGGQLQPYRLVDKPLEDSEYILDESSKVVTGTEEIVDILDLPNSEIITNYKPLIEEPKDWKTQYYLKYYENGEADPNTGKVSKRLIKQLIKDVYRKLNSPPSDWADGYSDYYYWDATKDPQYYIRQPDGTYVKATESDVERGAVLLQGGMSSVKGLPEAQAQITWQVATRPDNWEQTYSNYYVSSGTDVNAKTAVTAYTFDRYGANDTYTGRDEGFMEHTGQPLSTPPENWKWAYNTYTTRKKDLQDKWVYGVAIEGVHHYHMEKVEKKKAPTGWAENWRQYYVSISKKVALSTYKNKYVKREKGYYVSTSDAVSQGKLSVISKDKPYPKWVKGQFFVQIQDADTPPDFYKITNGVYERLPQSVAPYWDNTRTYYTKKVNYAPDFYTSELKPFYRMDKSVEIIPTFAENKYFYAVQDRMAKLIESGIDKLKSLRDTSSLQIDLELESNYDILDVIGVNDELIDAPVNKPIQRKIIKIKENLVTVNYEVD